MWRLRTLPLPLSLLPWKGRAISSLPLPFLPSPSPSPFPSSNLKGISFHPPSGHHSYSYCHHSHNRYSSSSSSSSSNPSESSKSESSSSPSTNADGTPKNTNEYSSSTSTIPSPPIPFPSYSDSSSSSSSSPLPPLPLPFTSPSSPPHSSFNSPSSPSLSSFPSSSSSSPSSVSSDFSLPIGHTDIEDSPADDLFHRKRNRLLTIVRSLPFKQSLQRKISKEYSFTFSDVTFRSSVGNIVDKILRENLSVIAAKDKGKDEEEFDRESLYTVFCEFMERIEETKNKNEKTQNLSAVTIVSKALSETETSRRKLNDPYPVSLPFPLPSPSPSSSSSSSSHSPSLRTTVDTLLRDTRGFLQYDPTLEVLATLRQPQDRYPLARSMSRKIVLHVGPTNSGKTHHAFQKLSEAKSGYYAGPLRLLAWEIYEKLSKQNIFCDLLTGQEVIREHGSRHVSSTVELLNTDTVVDVCVIDEAQLICDPFRGHAWTRSILGVAAHEVHICGDPRIEKIVANLLSFTGETYEVRKYKRLTPLKVISPLRNGLLDVKKGDCLVTFSRRLAYQIRNDLMSMGKKCCIIYGSLPPETRKYQAELFNNPSSGYDVLVSTDAIGLGLNFNIQRIIFTEMQKFDGKEKRYLIPSEVLQIAGRAGRFASEYKEGYVTTLSERDFDALRKIIKGRPPPLERAGIIATADILENLSDYRPGESFLNLLHYAEKYVAIDDSYFMCDMENQINIATLLEGISMKIEDKWAFCISPAKTDDHLMRVTLLQWAKKFSEGKPVDLFALAGILKRLPNKSDTENNMELFEGIYDVLSLYIWLARKFDKVDKNMKIAEQNVNHSWIEGGERVSEMLVDGPEGEGGAGRGGWTEEREREREWTDGTKGNTFPTDSAETFDSVAQLIDGGMSKAQEGEGEGDGEGDGEGGEGEGEEEGEREGGENELSPSLSISMSSPSPSSSSVSPFPFHSPSDDLKSLGISLRFPSVVDAEHYSDLVIEKIMKTLAKTSASEARGKRTNKTQILENRKGRGRSRVGGRGTGKDESYLSETRAKFERKRNRINPTQFSSSGSESERQSGDVSQSNRDNK